MAGPLDFSLTGILASIAGPLAAANIPIFVVSTYDTDYVLVRSERADAAFATLAAAGHTVTPV
ncbi:ACT domain-containing protein [Nonomuraea sp. NEAU-A123]|uniref:ACT domain-containing protein n=1 Tax=Nonomuraea sp. NEAU-A123 TaxID=2839649 RepID=UPI001BE42362|nr:ACT domain-containing protein [Nonomuraea sp. NEAU-A123]MBT2229806.1 ACT domain-containing protein [Nonomuraea sp. NEAU-A123]